jgi:Holliday junction DNA helicase RuvB
MRERLVSGGALPGEEEELASLRPSALDEYVGQQAVVRPLRIALEAARRRGEPLDHVLFHGPPGLGKTTLAHIIREEMGGNIQITSGPALKQPKDLVGLLTNMQRGDVFFIDEIHRLDSSVEEYLYPAMEDFRVDFILDKGANARMLNLKLRRFTLAAATTMTGLLSGPLRGRFGLTYHMDYYEPADLKRIVTRSAGILGIPIEEPGADEISRRSRGTPRIANRLLKRVRDYAEVEGSGTITAEAADEALKLEGIDQIGLDRLDRELLRVVIETYQGGPVGIEALAATLNEEQSSLVEVVEPYLLKIGFLARTPSGRRATHLAYQHLGVAARPGPAQGSLSI